jgi:MinD superfamily P-loop ATPase
MAVPVIKKLKQQVTEDQMVILDSPPGTSCNAVQSLRDSDYAILVTEPTAFGLHDLKMAVEVVKERNIPFGVVINKSDEYAPSIRSFCEQNHIVILGEIPYDPIIAHLYSKGELLAEHPSYQKIFSDLIGEIEGVIPCRSL